MRGHGGGAGNPSMRIALAPPTVEYKGLFQFATDVPFEWTTDQKFNAPGQSVTYINLDNFKLNNEVLFFEIKLVNFTNPTPINFEFKFIRRSDNTQVFSTVLTVPTPQSQGYEQWDWYRLRAWIGKVSYEINGPGFYDVTVTATGGWSFNETFSIEVKGAWIAEKAYIIIIATPVQGTAILDGISLGIQTPTNPILVSPGFHTVDVYAKGYTSTPRSLYILAGQTLTYEILLTKIVPVDFVPQLSNEVEFFLGDKNDSGLLWLVTFIRPNVTVEAKKIGIYLKSQIGNVAGLDLRTNIKVYEQLDWTVEPETPGNQEVTTLASNVNLSGLVGQPAGWKTINITPFTFEANRTYTIMFEIVSLAFIKNGQDDDFVISAAQKFSIPIIPPDYPPTLQRQAKIAYGAGGMVYNFPVAIALYTEQPTPTGTISVASIDFVSTEPTGTINVDSVVFVGLPAQWVIDSNPVKGPAFIDGTATGYNTPTPQIEVTTGIHTIDVKVSGYISTPLTREAFPGQSAAYTVQLVPETQTIFSINSEPTNATIFIDEINTGKFTPAEIVVTPGTHTVKVTKDGYYPESKTGTVNAGKTLTFSFVLVSIPPPPEKAYLQIDSEPPNAIISIGGIDTGKVTPAKIEVTPGTYEVQVTEDGYFPSDPQTGTVNTEETMDFFFTLVPIPPPPPGKGFLQIDSDPKEASIFIDGTDTGQLTSAVIEVEPGQHEVSVQKTDYQPAMQSVLAVEGETIQVVFKLEPVSKPKKLFALLLLGSFGLGWVLLKKRLKF